MIDEVRSGGSFCSQNDLRIHVGLGARSRADRIEVAWPSGAAEAIAGVDADQLVVIREGGGVIRRTPLVRRVVPGARRPNHLQEAGRSGGVGLLTLLFRALARAGLAEPLTH